MRRIPLCETRCGRSQEIQGQTTTPCSIQSAGRGPTRFLGVAAEQEIANKDKDPEMDLKATKEAAYTRQLNFVAEQQPLHPAN